MILDFSKAFDQVPRLVPAIWEEAPGQNWEKMIDLTSKLGEINSIEHKGSNIDTQNQVILDCIMPSIPLKHKCLSTCSLTWLKTFCKIHRKIVNEMKKATLANFNGLSDLCNAYDTL